jgi:hypothetical protein
MAGEIELATTRTLTHLVGHDSGGLYGRSPISSVLSTAYGSAQTSNYTSVATDLNLTVAMQTGTSNLTFTLLSAATAGAGSLQAVEKIDSGKGIVRVIDDTGVTLGYLTHPNHRMILTPDQDGTGWHVALDTGSGKWPPVSGNIYPPYKGALTTGIGSGSPAQDIIFVHPFDLDEPMYVDAVILNIGATSAAGLKFKTAIWAFNPTNPALPDGATLLSAGAEIGGAGTLTSQAYASVLDTPQWVRRGWIGCKLNATPAVANLVSGLTNPGAAGLVGSTNGVQVLGGFSTSMLKGYSFADAYANAMTTLVTGTAVTALTMPALSLRLG